LRFGSAKTVSCSNCIVIKFIGPPLRSSFQEFYGFTETDAERAVEKYREYFSDIGIFENKLYYGVVKFLKQLKDFGITMIIATSKPTVYAKKIASHFEISQYFENIVGSELDGTRSRKAEIITHALEAFNINHKTQSVMIGDRKHDIIGAHEIGIASVGVLWGYGSYLELEDAKATKIVNSLDELYYFILK
jgi:phosphoglycolate phosphatase